MQLQEQIIRRFPEKIKEIPSDASPLFGKMSPQQMLEHMSEYFRLGYGHPQIEERLYTPDSVAKLQSFLRSDRPFKENTPNPLLPDTPPSVRFDQYDEACADLAAAVQEFLDAFTRNPDLQVANPFFGMLDRELSFHLLAKHAAHHLRQFGIDI